MWPPRKIRDVIFAACTYARTRVLCRGYHATACFTYSCFFLCCFFLSSSRCKWILCRGFVEPSLPDAIYLIVKIENTRWPCNVMKTTRYILSFWFSFSLLEYCGTRGKCPRYSHARYEMQRLAKQTRSKICG